MAIQASTISSTQTLEEFRQEFNKLQSDVSTLESGPTFTSSIAFEGATADDYETTLTVTDPTADRTVTIQNKSGTVALIGTDTLDTIVLNGTDSSSTNAGDDLLLDGTDSSSTNAGDTFLFEPATGDHLLSQVPFEEYVLLETSRFGSDGTFARDFLVEETDGDNLEYEFGTSDSIHGAPFRPPAGGGPQFRTPTNDGTANQVFATDGSGNLSFVDRSEGMVLTGSTNNTVVTVTGASTGQGEGNLTFDGSTLTVTGAADVSGVATAETFEPDGDTAAGDNAAIGYTAGEGLILTGQGSTSDVTIKNDADGTVCYVPTGADDLRFPDGAKLELGTSADLQIYHDGSDSYISDGGTGDLKIGGATNVKIQNANGSEIMGIFAFDGAVTLYYDNSVKFATASGGISVTGTYTGTGLMTTGGNIVIPNDGNIGSAGDTDTIAIDSSGEVTFTQSIHVTDNIKPVNAGGSDLGGASKEFNDLYLNDSGTIQLGNDQEIRLRHLADQGVEIQSTHAAPLVRRSQDIFIVLDQTAAAGTDAGDNVILDASAAGTDVGDDILGEDEVFIHTGMQRNVINILGSDGKIKNSVAGFAPGAI